MGMFPICLVQFESGTSSSNGATNALCHAISEICPIFRRIPITPAALEMNKMGCKKDYELDSMSCGWLQVYPPSRPITGPAASPPKACPFQCPTAVEANLTTGAVGLRRDARRDGSEGGRHQFQGQGLPRDHQEPRLHPSRTSGLPVLPPRHGGRRTNYHLQRRH